MQYIDLYVCVCVCKNGCLRKFKKIVFATFHHFSLCPFFDRLLVYGTVVPKHKIKNAVIVSIENAHYFD